MEKYRGGCFPVPNWLLLVGQPCAQDILQHVPCWMGYFHSRVFKSGRVSILFVSHCRGAWNPPGYCWDYLVGFRDIHSWWNFVMWFIINLCLLKYMGLKYPLNNDYIASYSHWHSDVHANILKWYWYSYIMHMLSHISNNCSFAHPPLIRYLSTEVITFCTQMNPMFLAECHVLFIYKSDLVQNSRCHPKQISILAPKCWTCLSPMAVGWLSVQQGVIIS